MQVLKLIFATLACSTIVLAQNPVAADSPYQVGYASNLNVGDSVINITNSGARGAGLFAGTSASTTGAICVNVYAFAPEEQMISCCSCPVTPNGLVSLSVRNNLISNTLTGARPTSIVVKLLATVPVAGSCVNSATTPVASSPTEASTGATTFASGMAAWGTTLHATPTAGTYSVSETAFTPATPSAGELMRLGNLCTFINANGSGSGICRSCPLGGLGAEKL